MTMTLQELAQQIGVTLVGDGSIEVDGCAPIQCAGPREITFLANQAYVRHLERTSAAGVLIDPRAHCPGHLNRLLADDPYFAFRNAMVLLHGHRRHPRPMDAPAGEGPAHRALVSPRASVHAGATIGPGCAIHPHAVVEAGAVLGSGVILYPGAYVGAEARIGDECVLFPGAVVYERCVLGRRVTLHANTVVGQDGFGYATHGGEHHKIPQAGVVVIEDDVELGAGCAIERAAMGETRIGRGTKFADLISIGHGTRIGRHCLLVSLVGISGSVEVGSGVVLGGQVGVTGHLTIGDGVQAAGKAAIVDDVPAGMKVGGVPAVELQRAKRNALAGMELAEMARRLKRLEREVEELKGRG
jgi:UDP-3-O-[3-hydroxymyristoyl] glucosamine N-acyltransferase